MPLFFPSFYSKSREKSSNKIKLIPPKNNFPSSSSSALYISCPLSTYLPTQEGSFINSRRWCSCHFVFVCQPLENCSQSVNHHRGRNCGHLHSSIHRQSAGFGQSLLNSFDCCWLFPAKTITAFKIFSLFFFSLMNSINKPWAGQKYKADDVR